MTPAYLRQASAQRRQASAHRLQDSMSCDSHSFAHQSQISAHSLQICCANGLLREIASAANRQIAAQSIQQAGQSLGLALPTISAQQLPHSVAQSLQAAMQSLAF
nr:hypothetical protein [Nitrosomonas sp. Nm166]